MAAAVPAAAHLWLEKECLAQCEPAALRCTWSCLHAPPHPTGAAAARSSPSSAPPPLPAAAAAAAAQRLPTTIENALAPTQLAVRKNEARLVKPEPCMLHDSHTVWVRNSLLSTVKTMLNSGLIRENQPRLDVTQRSPGINQRLLLTSNDPNTQPQPCVSFTSLVEKSFRRVSRASIGFCHLCAVRAGGHSTELIIVYNLVLYPFANAN